MLGLVRELLFFVRAAHRVRVAQRAVRYDADPYWDTLGPTESERQIIEDLRRENRVVL